LEKIVLTPREQQFASICERIRSLLLASNLSFHFILRLKQIRVALRTPTDEGEQKEILVRTASGACLKFGGINRSFARRLMEWEERQGISPEASAMALLHTPAHRFREVRVVSSKPKKQASP
jgi:hypothetical protein